MTITGRPTKLTDEAEEAILKGIRRGAFDWVAAEAGGIDRRTFYRWLERGEAGERRYAVFARNVMIARAESRLEAEASVRDRNPFAWLRYGPGRERPDAPGWTNPVRPPDPPPDTGPEDPILARLDKLMIDEANGIPIPLPADWPEGEIPYRITPRRTYPQPTQRQHLNRKARRKAQRQARRRKAA